MANVCFVFALWVIIVIGLSLLLCTKQIFGNVAASDKLLVSYIRQNDKYSEKIQIDRIRWLGTLY